MKSLFVKYSHSAVILLLCIVAFLFLLFFIILSANNRPVSEDLVFMAIFQQQGWLGSLFYSIEEVSFRPVSKIVFNLFFCSDTDFNNIKYYVLFFHLVSLTLLIIAAYQLLKTVIEEYMKAYVRRSELFLYSVLFSGAFFFSAFLIAETWFWLISAAIHLWACIFAVMGVAFILKKRSTVFSYMIFCFSFLFVAGSSENMGLLAGAALGMWFIILLMKYFKKKEKKYSALVRKVTIALLLFAVVFAFNLSGRGTSNRVVCQQRMTSNINDENLTSHGRVTEFSFSNFHKVIFNYRNLVALAMSSAFIFLGIRLRKNKFAFSLEKSILLRKYLLVILISLTGTLIIAIGPLYYFFHGPGPLRAWAPVSLVLTFILSITFLMMGFYSKGRWIGISAFAVSLLTIPVMGLYIYRQHKIVAEYSSAYDARCVYLQSLQKSGNRNTVDLEGLPDSGFLPSGDITHDENNVLNSNLQYLLKLDFKIKSTTNYYYRYTIPESEK